MSSKLNGLKLGFIAFTLVLSQATAGVNEYFETIKSDPNALYAFFKEMPKGGELHYHFSGGSYAETMLALAGSRNNYCLDPTAFSISVFNGVCDGVNVAQLADNPTLYDQVIRAWSMKNFISGPVSGSDHFFAAFLKFGPTVWDFKVQLLADIIQRAADQHELYMEIIVFYLQNASDFAKLIEKAPTLADKQRILLADKNFQDNINQSIIDSKSLVSQARHELGCDSSPNNPVCSVTIKFQYFVMRGNSQDNVFAQALAGFVAASRTSDIVAVNLVQNEDGILALRDYRAQMQIFNYLHKSFPKVHIALHAGELEPKGVTPSDLRFHIRDAVMTGHAERIGHGVDIAYEDNSIALLKDMVKKQVAVEINLTSNHEILNIFGKNHPLNYYLSHRVPVVLSTDDEGILRTDLTRQYVEAVENHHLDYSTIKTINRNALTYSFLPGKSIWVDPAKQTLVEECKKLETDNCKQFIKSNEKARLQWQLEKFLSTFESSVSEK